MRRFTVLITTLAVTMSGLVISSAHADAGLGLSLAIAPTAQTKAKVTKPSAPTIKAISSSTVKKGKVNVKVTITLPATNGGSKITGSKVTLGGKTCTIAKTKTSCTIKSIKNGKSLSVYANSKNIKGYGAKSARVTYFAGASAWSTTPAAPVVSVVADTPAAAAPAPAAPVVAIACAAGGTCVVGDSGPGGGIVYYVDSAGFKCGLAWTAIGSPTLEKCHYLEVAPSGWSSVSDPQKVWATGTSMSGNAIQNVQGITHDLTVYNNAWGIGRGFEFSAAIVAQGNDTTTAAGAARAYTGGTLVDWYLPNTAELNLLCQWNRGVTQDVASACTGGTINSSRFGAETAALQSNAYWSSSALDASRAWYQNVSAQLSYDKSAGFYVRPVRAF